MASTRVARYVARQCPSPAAPRGPTWRWRLAALGVVVAACLPYLALKALWLSGDPVGWNDLAQAESGVLIVGNAVTVLMEGIAVAVALALTFGWGQRLPVWLVLLPMWVATGLLAPIALGVPAGWLASAAQGSEVAPSGALAGWVYAVVYGGFTVQAVALLVAFVLYAATRWPDVFRRRVGDMRRGATYPFQRVIARGCTVAVLPYAAMFAAWGFSTGLGPHQTIAQTSAQRVALFVVAALALVGLVGMQLLVAQSPRVARLPLCVPLAAAWVGAGATFASSLYRVVGLLVGAGETGVTELGALVLLAGTLAGLLLGVAGLMLLAEREA